MLLPLLASLSIALATGPAPPPAATGMEGLAAAIFRQRAERGAPPPVAPATPDKATTPGPPAPSAAPKATDIAGRLKAKALDWPIRAAHRISSPFGTRVHPILKRRMFHNGIDLAAPTGTAIHAPGDGVIVRISEDRISGRVVSIDHGDGITTTYAHLHGVPGVPVGTPIRRGQRFATVGTTGRSTGPHLHYMVLVDGNVVDPALTRAPEGERIASAR